MINETGQPNLFEDEQKLDEEQLQQLAAIKRWVQTEAEFYGRTDDNFLLMFLWGCKFDVEKTKTKMIHYYEIKKKIPQWWANRDITNDKMWSLAHLKASTVFIDRELHHPMVAITKLDRFPKYSDEFDDMAKLGSIMIETALQRRSCQLNGGHWIMDCKNYPKWFAIRLLSPIMARNIVNSFIRSLPLRVKSVNLVNTPLIAIAVYTVARPLLPQKLTKRVHFYRSEWTNLFDHVPRELVPEEYGGYAGPMATHEDAFLREMMSYNDYLKEDNNYGSRKQYQH